MRRRKTGTVVTGRSPHHSLRFFYQYFRLHSDGGGLLRSTPRVMSLTQAEANAAEAANLRSASTSRWFESIVCAAWADACHARPHGDSRRQGSGFPSVISCRNSSTSPARPLWDPHYVRAGEPGG
jgi:hypothetical protein